MFFFSCQNFVLRFSNEVCRNRTKYANNQFTSLSIDLDQVTSRLLEIPFNRNASPRPRSPSDSRVNSVSIQPSIPCEVHERNSYNGFVEDGDRLLYFIDLMNEMAQDPFSHWNMLRPWLNYRSDFESDPNKNLEWLIFERQQHSWLNFRRWQAHNRRTGRSQYVELKYPWNSIDRAFNCFVIDFRRTTSNYTKAMKKLLAEYDFIRSFQPHDDSTRQDKLTTWIEYLGFEYAEHYRYNRLLKKLQSEYDQTWRTLKNAKVLRPFETEAYVCNIKSTYHHQSEREKAEMKAKSAAAIFASCHQVSRAEHVTKKAEAQAKLNATETSLKMIKRRNDLVTEFCVAARNYLTTKNEAECQNMRTRWILKQISLIEAELTERGVIEIGLDAPREMKRRRRGLNNEDGDGGEDGEDGEDNEAAYDRSIKKSRQTADTSDSLRDCQIISSGFQSKRRKRDHDVVAGDAPRFKRFKQSGSILKAARSDGDKRAKAKKIDEQSNLKANKSNNGLLQEKIVDRETRFFAISQPLRRSARIAARRKGKAELTPPAISAQESLFSKTTRTRSTTALRIQSSSIIIKRNNRVKTAKGRCSL